VALAATLDCNDAERRRLDRDSFNNGDEFASERHFKRPEVLNFQPTERGSVLVPILAKRIYYRLRREMHYVAGAPRKRIPLDWSVVHFNRTAVINALINRRGYVDYLEIGCGADNNFDAVAIANKIGVDPVSGGTHRMTSDEFFERHRLMSFDLVFIDGLHTYIQARRDLFNAMKQLRLDGAIVLHDMLPTAWHEQHMPRCSMTWMGDVWKLGFELSKSNFPSFRIIETDRGVGVLTKEKEINLPDAPPLSFQGLDYAYLLDNWQKLPITKVRPFFEGLSTPPAFWEQ